MKKYRIGFWIQNYEVFEVEAESVEDAREQADLLEEDPISSEHMNVEMDFSSGQVFEKGKWKSIDLDT